MSEVELLRLRKEVIHSREQMEDLQEELKSKDELIYNLEGQIATWKTKVKNADQKTLNWETQMDDKVRTAIKDNENKIDLLNKTLQEKHEANIDLIHRLDQANEQLAGGQSEIAFYKKQIEQFAGKYELKEALADIKKYRDELANKEAQIIDVNKLWNDISPKCEDFIAENQFLGDKTNAPLDNYEVNLEEIILADKAKDVDYKAKVLHLEQEVEELQNGQDLRLILEGLP